VGYGFRNTGYGGPSYRSYGSGGGRGGFAWHITPAIKQLIIANVAVFICVALLHGFFRLGEPIYLWFGLVPKSVLHGLLWQPVTYMFLHGGFWHLFFNMFVLWMFGMPLERDWGRRRFLKYYFFTGIGAGILAVAMNWVYVLGGWADGLLLSIPTVGASGAIYGILLAFGLLYPNSKVFVMLLFPIPARLFVIIIGGIAFMNAMGQPGSGVSHVAHLGGMLFGLFYLRGPKDLYWGLRKLYAGWQLERARRKFRVYVREQEERESDQAPPDDWVN
jgi:membrane associated rhomboid family serine protease